MAWQYWTLGLVVACATLGTACGDDGSTNEAGSNSGTADVGPSTSQGGSGMIDGSGSGTAGMETPVACAWIAGEAEPMPSTRTFPGAVATCLPDREEGPISRLLLFSRTGVTCDNPSYLPDCDTAYEGIRLFLSPQMQQVGSYPLSDLNNTVDLQSGGGKQNECGFIGTTAMAGQLHITSVSASEVRGYLDAEVSDFPDNYLMQGSFAASLCP